MPYGVGAILLKCEKTGTLLDFGEAESGEGSGKGCLKNGEGSGLNQECCGHGRGFLYQEFDASENLCCPVSHLVGVMWRSMGQKTKHSGTTYVDGNQGSSPHVDWSREKEVSA